MEQQQAPAGWYVGPQGLEAFRWWDGSTWTHYTHDGTPTAETVRTPTFAPNATPPTPSAAGQGKISAPRRNRSILYRLIGAAVLLFVVVGGFGNYLSSSSDPTTQWVNKYEIPEAKTLRADQAQLANELAASNPSGTAIIATCTTAGDHVRNMQQNVPAPPNKQLRSIIGTELSDLSTVYSDCVTAASTGNQSDIAQFQDAVKSAEASEAPLNAWANANGYTLQK